MRHYLFITTLIRNIGGGHIYTANKMKFLKSQGFGVGLFHADVRSGKIIINEFEFYKDKCDSHLQYPTYFWDHETQQDVITSICDSIPDNCTEVIIESQTLICATWGELLAKRLNAKHIIYCLSEDPKIRNKDMYGFLNFKLDRRELAGITQKSLAHLFNGWREIPENESYYLTARGSGIHVLDQIPYRNMDSIPLNDFVIGSIGRIDKLFLKESLSSVINFAKKMPNKTFTVLLIGGASNNRSLIEIEDRFKNIDNVELYITGLIFPIPIELVRLADIYISSAGACRISQSLGIPTIAIDGRDYKPIGIVGETTNNILHRADEPIIPLVDLLEDILIRDKFSQKETLQISDRRSYNNYSDHLEFVNKSAKSREYYSINDAALSINEKIKKTILRIFGRELTTQIINKLLSPAWMRLKRYDLVK